METGVDVDQLKEPLEKKVVADRMTSTQAWIKVEWAACTQSILLDGFKPVADLTYSAAHYCQMGCNYMFPARGCPLY